MFNIAMLKRVFSPKFYLHDIRQTGEHEATTRWTMVSSSLSEHQRNPAHFTIR